jgi:hypothetical protein
MPSPETITILLTIVGMVGAAIWTNGRTISGVSDRLTNKLESSRRESEEGRSKLYAALEATAKDIRTNFVHKEVLVPELAVRDERLNNLDRRVSDVEDDCERRHFHRSDS